MSIPQSTSVRIDPRFCGPARSGNGGYTAGLVASALAPTPTPIRVRLRMPPPLTIDLDLTATGDLAHLTGPDGLVAEGVRTDDELPVVDTVEPAEARAAEASYPGLAHHPFPTCFACGPENATGLRLRPGPLGDGRTACTWTPSADLADADGLVGTPYLWAALDCPGGWTIDLEGRPSVLGQITTCVDARPPAGEACVVMGRHLGEDGRKTHTATTLYDADGRVLARATQIWIAVDPADFR